MAATAVRRKARLALRVVIDLHSGSQHPVAELPASALLEAAKRLEDRAYATYKARLQAQKRLRKRGMAWNALLIASATSTTIASVSLLSSPSVYGARGPTLVAVLAILSLVASLVVTNMEYAGRGQAMGGNYRRIQQIAFAAEALRTQSNPRADLEQIQREYEIALESSENHSDADYERTRGPDGARYRLWRDNLVSFAPYLSLAVPIAVVIPPIVWFLGAN